MSRIEDQTLALAGLFQAAVETDSLANDGFCDESAFGCSLDSLFRFDADSTRAVFGDVAGLSRGLSALVGYLGGETNSSGRNISYYVLSMLKLALKLMRDDDASRAVFDGLRRIHTAVSDFGLDRRTAVARVDGLYQSSISSLSPRILVRGEQNFLRDDAIASRVRTLLLAGIRAGVLWHQLGGNRWRLLWSRRAYVETARELLRRHQSA